MRLQVEVVGSLDQVLPPVRGEALDAAVAEGIRLRAEGSVGLEIDPCTALFPDLVTLALSLDVEILRGASVVHSLHLFPDGYDRFRLSLRSRNDGPNRSIAIAWFPEIEDLLQRDGGDVSRWYLRVRGSDRDVLRSWHADRRWTGEVLIPFADAIARERGDTGETGRDL